MDWTLGYYKEINLNDNRILQFYYRIGNGVAITSQSQLEQFRRCTQINNNVNITFPNPDFSVFDNLIEIFGNLTITGCNINITAFPSLKLIIGSLNIHNNTFTTISGFGKLKYIRDMFLISNTPVNFMEFKSLTIIGSIAIVNTNLYSLPLLNSPSITTLGSITISGNPYLLSLPVFDYLSNIGPIGISTIWNDNIEIQPGNIFIKNNALLSELPRFNSLKTMGDLYIYGNAILSSFYFDSLVSMNSLIINNNPSLFSLPPFSSLTSLGNLVIINSLLVTLPDFNISTIGDFIIDGTAMQYISGFYGLTQIGNFYINNNSLLANMSNFPSVVSIGLVVVTNNPVFIFPEFSNTVTISDINITNNGCTYLPDFYISNVGYLIINNNPNLHTFPSFSNLLTIDNLVVNQSAFTNITTKNNVPIFNSLIAIGNIVVDNNLLLTYIQDFTSISIGNVIFGYNPNLRLQDYNSVNTVGTITI
jgi:hypothetical protein